MDHVIDRRVIDRRFAACRLIHRKNAPVLVIIMSAMMSAIFFSAGALQTLAAENSIPDPASSFKKNAQNTPASSDNVSLVQGLTLLSGGESGPAANGGDPVSAVTAVNGGDPAEQTGPINISAGNTSAGEGEPQIDPNNPGDILFPGKIKEVKLGASTVGTLSLTIRWFRPEELGLSAQYGGKIRIERAASADGPWTLVAPDAQGISAEKAAYWFAVSRDKDAAPFYLRTVQVDSFGKEWIDLVPTPIDLGASLDKHSAEAEKKSDFSNVSLEKELPSYSADQVSGGGSPWNDSLAESEKRDLAAALEQNRGTGSVQPSPAPQTASAAAPPQKSKPKRQPLTDPGTMTLNPLLTRGFGIFSSNNDRVENGYPGVANQSDYPAPASGPYTAGLNQPASGVAPEPPKRSIFMSPQQYREELAAYAPNDYQNGYQNGYAPQSPYSGTMSAGGVYPATNGNETLYSAEGPINSQNAMPSVIYEDANGNVIDNPFANGQMNGQMMSGQMMGGQMGNMPMIVDGNGQMISQDGMVYNDPYGGMNGQMMNGQMMDGSMLTLPANGDMNTGGTFSDVSYSDSYNGPYTSQESTLGTAANLPGPSQTPVAPNVLPPQPTTR